MYNISYSRLITSRACDIFNLQNILAKMLKKNVRREGLTEFISINHALCWSLVLKSLIDQYNRLSIIKAVDQLDKFQITKEPNTKLGLSLKVYICTY